MSPLDNPSAMSRAISSCRGVSTRPSGEERLAGGLAAMIGDVSCVSIPCPLFLSALRSLDLSKRM